MISDAKMRAHLLSAIHGLRNSNTGWVPVSDMNFGGLEPVTPGRIHTVCEQLAEAGLIAFKPAPGGPDNGLGDRRENRNGQAKTGRLLGRDGCAGSYPGQRRHAASKTASLGPEDRTLAASNCPERQRSATLAGRLHATAWL